MKSLAIVTAAMLALSGCAIVKVGDSTEFPKLENVVVVPAGHMPPSGMCRIWFPDRPIAQQPSPGDCKELQGKAPAGAYLIRT